MTPEQQDHTGAATGDVAALRQILATEFGEPAPLDGYRHPLSDEVAERLEAQLDDVERAQADAAARLPTLYAD